VCVRVCVRVRGRLCQRGREGERERGREGEKEIGREEERERGGLHLSPHRAGAEGAELVQEVAGGGALGGVGLSLCLYLPLPLSAAAYAVCQMADRLWNPAGRGLTSPRIGRARSVRSWCRSLRADGRLAGSGAIVRRRIDAACGSALAICWRAVSISKSVPSTPSPRVSAPNHTCKRARPVCQPSSKVNMVDMWAVVLSVSCLFRVRAKSPQFESNYST